MTLVFFQQLASYVCFFLFDLKTNSLSWHMLAKFHRFWLKNGYVMHGSVQ